MGTVSCLAYTIYVSFSCAIVAVALVAAFVLRHASTMAKSEAAQETTAASSASGAGKRPGGGGGLLGFGTALGRQVPSSFLSASVLEGGGGGGEDGSGAAAAESVHYPFVERQLRRGFHALGLLCARRPLQVLGACALLLLLCCLGLLRFRWVASPGGGGSARSPFSLGL